MNDTVGMVVEKKMMEKEIDALEDCILGLEAELIICRHCIKQTILYKSGCEFCKGTGWVKKSAILEVLNEQKSIPE